MVNLEDENFDASHLREFELSLLANLGYGITFDIDSETGEGVREDSCYQFIAEQGFSSLFDPAESMKNISGSVLLAISKGDYSGPADVILKSVIRRSFQTLLGDKPLKSRSLFEGRRA
jgi:DNA repair protein RecO (recombination protein O)